MPVSMRSVQAEDWLEDLREFGPDIVGAACKEWRRKPGGRRPTPGDIRELCIAERAARSVALPAPIPVLSDEEAMAVADKWAQGHGFQCIEAAQRAGVSLSVRVGPGRFKAFDGLPRYPKAPPVEPVRDFKTLGASAQPESEEA